MDNFSSISSLIYQLDRWVLVFMSDNREIYGVLSSFDQYCNLVLENAFERKYFDTKYTHVPLGVQIIRGDEICFLGDVEPQDLTKPIPGLQYTTLEEILTEAQEGEEDSNEEDQSPNETDPSPSPQPPYMYPLESNESIPETQ